MRRVDHGELLGQLRGALELTAIEQVFRLCKAEDDAWELARWRNGRAQALTNFVGNVKLLLAGRALRRLLGGGPL